MDNTRRKFLKIAGAAALAGIGAPALVKLSSTAAFASSEPAAEHGSAAGGHGEVVAATGVRLGMVVDMRKFAETPEMLDAAIAACNKVHNIPHFPDRKNEIKWIWKAPYANVFPEQEVLHKSEMAKTKPFAVLCNHCDNPSCVKACPTKATFVQPENGIVAMDFHRCIGCRFCMAACPYGARSFNWQDPRPFITSYNPDFPTRMRGVVEKCHWCLQRTRHGRYPACVEFCPVGARKFGNLLDPESEVSKVLARKNVFRLKADLNTFPKFFYFYD